MTAASQSPTRARPSPFLNARPAAQPLSRAMASKSAETLVSLLKLLSCLSDGLAASPVEIGDVEGFYADPENSIPAVDDAAGVAVVDATAVREACQHAFL